MSLFYVVFFFFLMIRRPPRSTQSRSSAASDVYKRQVLAANGWELVLNQEFKDFKPVGATIYRERDGDVEYELIDCLLYTSPSPRDRTRSRMPSSA